MERMQKFMAIFGPMLGFVLAALSLVISASNFSKDQKSKSALEFKRDFWSKQSDIYLKTSQAIGTICAEINKSDMADFDHDNYRRSKAAFESLYWGEMNFVQDSVVITDMKSFDQYIKDFNPMIPNIDYRQTLIKLGNKIIITCRNSYMNSYNNLQVENIKNINQTLTSK